MLVTALGAVGLWRETIEVSHPPTHPKHTNHPPTHPPTFPLFLSPTLQALHAMKEKGIQINKVTYGAVVNACAYSKDMAAARRMMEEMRAAGVMPDAVEYSNLLHVRLLPTHPPIHSFIYSSIPFCIHSFVHPSA